MIVNWTNFNEFRARLPSFMSWIKCSFIEQFGTKVYHVIMLWNRQMFF